MTDILSYVEFPDRKVLSGTEKGNLLLWDGPVIKFEIFKLKYELPHTGGIIDIQLIDNPENSKEKLLITVGSDGYIRWWDYNTINTTEIIDDKPFILDPIKEVKNY